MSNQIGHSPVRLEATSTESRQVRVPDTSHLTPPTEIQNSLGLASPAADPAVPCKKSEILQQRNDDGAISTQIGHTPVRSESRGQTAVQCRQNQIIGSSRTVAGQFHIKLGMHPFGWKPTAKQQFSASRATLRSSRTVAGQCQIRSGMHPFGWKPLQPTLGRSECRHFTLNTTHRN